ncbi:hypothetical protein [Nakamurella sp.]|uniref:hypothetical protein n=1 Tax=Nakamurella sp. TaxID=1869182 RepID=UPI003B3BBA19
MSGDIVTVAEVKKQLNIPETDDSQDDELAVYIAAVTEVVEDIVGPVVPREVTETHDAAGPVLLLRQPPAVSITSVVEAGATLTADDYLVDLDAGILRRRQPYGWVGGIGAVTVTYQGGRNTTPAAVKLAAKELVMVNFRPQLGGDYSPFDTDSPEEGIPGEVRLGFFVPNRVRELLKPHARGRWLP